MEMVVHVISAHELKQTPNSLPVLLALKLTVCTGRLSNIIKFATCMWFVITVGVTTNPESNTAYGAFNYSFNNMGTTAAYNIH
jgi:hypothetical protein